MKKFKTFLILIYISVVSGFSAEITPVIVLDKNEQARLVELSKSNKRVAFMCDSVKKEVEVALQHVPVPLEEIFFEGLLETHPDRIKTVRSFDDLNHVATLIYAGYLDSDVRYGEKVKEIVKTWARTYSPDGNPINENKLMSLFWGYYMFGEHFDEQEKKLVENWLRLIAQKEMSRNSTPNNNWEAKRLKIIGAAGVILQDSSLVNYAAEGFRKYISTAYYEDGTSNDFHQRDALAYHTSGIKPCLEAFINLSKVSRLFDLYSWQSSSGASLKKAVGFVVPYATGTKQREEWRNSKVELDQRRAAAGIEMYQPGKLYNPEDAYSLFELACYYNPDFFHIFEKDIYPPYTTSWIGLLNSPLIRGDKKIN